MPGEPEVIGKTWLFPPAAQHEVAVAQAITERPPTLESGTAVPATPCETGSSPPAGGDPGTVPTARHEVAEVHATAPRLLNAGSTCTAPAGEPLFKVTTAPSNDTGGPAL